MTCILLRGKQREVLTQTSREGDVNTELREDASLGGWSIAATSQGMLLEEARTDSPLEPPEGEWPC